MLGDPAPQVRAGRLGENSSYNSVIDGTITTLWKNHNMDKHGDFPDARTRLVEAAIRLLAENGPSEVKARSVSAEAGLSTMGVYTHFGGVPELLQAVADEGFRRQAAVFGGLPITDNPMVDLSTTALGCRDFARSSPHLYDLMFGLSIQGRYSPARGDAVPVLSGQSPEFKVAYAHLVEGCRRLVEAKCVKPIAPESIAVQMWSALHGFILLELAGHFAEFVDPSVEILMPMCINLVVGLGARRERAERAAATAVNDWAALAARSSIARRSRRKSNSEAR